MLPGGAHDICHNLHIPTPGRVQYYRAECLPFVPHEIKTQLRFPKAYATSQENLRYIDQVKLETEKFLAANVKQNYFDGSETVPFTATIGEAEVLFSASDKVKALAESGALKEMHANCEALTEAAESQYISTKDRLSNIVDAINSKEDDIVAEVNEDHELTLKTNASADEASIANILSYVKGGANVSIENMRVIENAMATPDDDSALKASLSELASLAATKAEVLRELTALQAAFNEHVEDDAAGQADLSAYKTQVAALEGALDGLQGEGSDSQRVLASQLAELVPMAEQARKTFEQYASATAERHSLFSDFLAETPNTDRLDLFKDALIKHLSMTIVVKESRQRYQKEQFDRMIMASSAHSLQSQTQSLDTFCEEYARMIEYLIEKSNDFKCPKIRANYDDFEESTIRPLNSTVFYYFFSQDRTKRNIAQWLLSSVRYPNEKIRRAYTRFFA